VESGDAAQIVYSRQSRSTVEAGHETNRSRHVLDLLKKIK
jgi:hypothetical protein